MNKVISNDELVAERAALSPADRAALDAKTEILLAAAVEAQNAYWAALRALELATGVDLDDVGELEGLTVQEVIDSFGPDGLGGAD